MKKLHLFVVLILLFGLIGPIGVRVVVAQNVCPDGGEWHKVEAGDPNFLSYTADEGYIVTAICAKGGSENSQGGYLVYMEENGTYNVGEQVCLTFSGIGSQTGSVSRNTELEGNICSDLSHASFKVGETSPTPEPPTPEPPTPEPPTPEPPTPEPPTPEPPTPEPPTPEPPTPEPPTPEPPTPEPPTPEPPTPEPPTPEPPTPEPPTPEPPTPPDVDTEPDTGASIVGISLLGTGLIGGVGALTIFFRKKKKMG